MFLKYLIPFILGVLLYFPLFAQTDSIHYAQALQSSWNPTPQKVYKGLTPLKKSNRDLVWKKIKEEDYVLMVSWKSNASYYVNDSTGFYNTGQYDLWVTAVPDIQNFCRKYQGNDLPMRLKQLLGLPPMAQNKYFITFWVRPQDIFRPCPDAEIDDTKCDVCFPKKTSDAYREWFNTLRTVQYFNKPPYVGYPWTQLGYTYDWNVDNSSHIGLSEFVVRQNAKIVVDKVYTTEEYRK
jgi:hypothetical protein